MWTTKCLWKKLEDSNEQSRWYWCQHFKNCLSNSLGKNLAPWMNQHWNLIITQITQNLTKTSWLLKLSSSPPLWKTRLTWELVRKYSIKHTVFLCEFSSSPTTFFQSLRREGSGVWPTVSGSNHWRRSEIAGASQLAQWLRILLAMQETWVQSLVWEDPWCRGATNPVLCNYWSLCALEPELLNRSGHCDEKPERWVAPTFRN